MVDCNFKSEKMVVNERGTDSEQIFRERADWKKRMEKEDLPDVRSNYTRDPTPEPTADAGMPGDPNTPPEQQSAAYMENQARRIRAKRELFEESQRLAEVKEKIAEAPEEPPQADQSE
jgi:hypothetical protein